MGRTGTLSDDPDYHLDQTKCDAMAAALADLKAKRRLDAQPGEDYGFAAPLLTVSVTASGQTDTFTFGDTNTITGDVYLQKEGGGTPFYTAASAKAGCFEYGKADLFEPFNPAGLTASRLERIEYTRFRRGDGPPAGGVGAGRREKRGQFGLYHRLAAGKATPTPPSTRKKQTLCCRLLSGLCDRPDHRGGRGGPVRLRF